MKIAYLGPQGTFSEQAALDYARGAEIIPYRSIIASAMSVLQGEADEAVCPIENSYQGSVTDTLDVLLHEEGLHIRQEMTLDIVHNLMVKPGVLLAAVKRVYSHPQALGQCRRYLEQHLPDAELAASLSTAEAVEQAMASDMPAAAIAPSRSADLYGAEILAPGIQDDDNNVTRFVVLGKSDHPRTGNDLTSVAMEFSEDKPGQLFGVLQEFAERNINLTKIESRPTRLGLGKYYFLMDIEGHADDPTLAEALTRVEQRTSRLIKFGSYPRASTESYLIELVRSIATLRHYHCQQEVLRSGIHIDLLLESKGKEIGVEVRATSSPEGIRRMARSFRDMGLAQAIFVFADPTVAESARTAAAEWPEELAATAVFTTAEHIGELL